MIQIEKVGSRERRYSDQNVKLRQVETGSLYEDAVDVVPCPYTYEETDIPIPDDEDATTEDYEAAMSEIGASA